MIRRNRILDDLDEQIRDHIERETQDNIDRGMLPDKARSAALRKFGNVMRVKEDARAVWTVVWLDHLLQDLRFGLRALRKNPGFTVVAIITLALGIGANTAIFSILDAVLLRPLPYKDPSRLVWATEHTPSNRGTALVISPDFAAWQAQNDVFEQIGASSGGSGANLTGVGPATRVSITNVTVGFFRVLGVRPILGRLFVPEEGRLGQEHVALLSEPLWRNQFGSDPSVLGKTIELDGASYAIVGVMPASVRPIADLWTPFATNEARFSPQSPTWAALSVIGRLKPGLGIAQAKSDLQVITHRMDAAYPPQAAAFRVGTSVEVLPLQEFLVHSVRSLLLLLQGATGVLLLIACVNIVNLLLSRGVIRRKETAVRAALGASRGRLIRQFLTEALLLSGAGTALGSVAGFWGTAILKRLIPPTLSVDIPLDLRVLVFSAVTLTVAVLVFALGPAIVASRTSAGESLSEASSRIGTHRGSHRLHNFLSAAEVALSLVLLVGAALLARSLLRVSDEPLGFDPHGLLICTVQRPLTVNDPSEYSAFFESALQRIEKVPAVADAAVISQYPLGPPHNASFRLNVQDSGQATPPQPFKVTDVSADYFRTMRIRLLKGRTFNETDGANTQPVVVMNDVLARTLFNDRNPIGQRVSFPNMPTGWMAVVGVVSAVRDDSLEEQPGPELFLPYLQQPAFGMTFVLRTASDPDTLVGAVRSVIQQMDKNQPVADVTTMDGVISAEIAPRRFNAMLLGIFASLALGLAAVGIYGVVAYSCSQRTREFGVRIALGANRYHVLQMIIAATARTAIAGAAVGLAASLALTRLISSMLYETSAEDPLTFAAVTLLLLLIALLAAYIPARRAMRVDPMVALRHE